MNVRRFRKAGIACVAASLLVLASCSDDDPTTTQQNQQGGGVRERIERVRLAANNWGYPSPFAYIRGPGLAHALMIFDTLVWKDADGKTIPWLATRWEGSPDGREWRFTLRDGVTWHDGRPLTADDVAFTYDYLTKGAGSTAPGSLGQIPVTEVVVESPTVVLLRLSGSFAPFLDSVAGRVPILPRHVWESVTEPARQRGPEAVMGSGPYRLDAYDEAAGTYRYVANEAFYLGAQKFKTVEFVPTSDDFRSLQRGELDVASTGFAGGAVGAEEGLPDAALAPFKGAPFKTIEGAGEFTRALHFNLTKGFPYDDKKFRQAIAYTLDRQDFVRRIMFGKGEPGSVGGLAPSHPMAVKDLPAYNRDLPRARALLDEIGLRDADGDGRRDLPDGSPFTPELQTNARYNPNTPQVVLEQLRDVGIHVTIRSQDLAAADAAAAAGNYEMALIAYGGLGADPDGLRTRLSSRVPARNFQRVYGWNNPTFEDAAAAQINTIDADRRKELVGTMQREVAEDVPLLNLYHPSRITIFNANVFDAWYFTPGGVFGGYPGILNKHALVTAKKTGF